MSEYFETGSKKGRGRAQRTLDLIDAMYEIAEQTQPITGRGVGYKLFARSLIPSMSRKDMQRVYRLLRDAREEGVIPWEWIVDETRCLEKAPSWDNPQAFAEAAARSYRLEFWNQQPARVEVWSEKGTVRGVLAPVLNKYGVGFRVMHGFASATAVYDVAQDDDGRPLVVLYVGDYDPSGLYMSEMDIPDRLEKYKGDHVEPRRIALTGEQTRGLLSFPASDKRDDPRYRWFVSSYGAQCWELDALDPRVLRDIVEDEIKSEIEPVAWERCVRINKAQQASMEQVVDAWSSGRKKKQDERPKEMKPRRKRNPRQPKPRRNPYVRK
jgi:hypothetical protein